MSSIEIIRTPRGKYKGRLLDDNGVVVPIRPGTVGGPRSAADKAAGRKAVQAVLKAMYERQQTGAAGA